MPRLYLQTFIQASPGLVFDLSRSIDLHQTSTSHTHERAIAGCTSGLIELGQTVTWRAKHFGIYQTLTSVISELQYPHFFVDEQVRGAFARSHHEHRFLPQPNGGTLADEVFDYTSPLGLLGRLADALFLQRYMTSLLHRRNQVIKHYAETDLWKQLPGFAHKV